MIDHHKIITEVSNFFDISIEAIKSPSRKQEIVHARHIAMYLVRKLNNFSYPYIAKLFERNDHTTVIHAEKNIVLSINKNENIRQQVEMIEEMISNENHTFEQAKLGGDEIFEETRAEFEEPINILDKEIEKVEYLSVRTANCFKTDNIIFFRDLVQRTTAELMNIKNFGLNSLYEVQEILEKHNLKLGRSVDIKEIEQNNNNLQEGKIYIDHHSIREVTDEEFRHLNTEISTLGLSHRTNQVLKISGIDKIAQLVSKKEKELLREPNFGRKSLYEIKDYLQSINLDFNINVLHWNNENIEKYTSKTEIIKDYASSSISDEIQTFFGVLNDRELDVLKKRYGIGYDRYLTLEEIGQEQNITRERIRQIEAKALRKIKNQFPKELNEIITAKKNYLWNILSDNKNYIVAPTNYQNIKAYDALLIDLVFPKLWKFLDKYFFNVSNYGWIKEDHHIDNVLDIIKVLTSLESKFSDIKNKFYPIFPQTISRFKNKYNTSNEILEIAANMSNACFTYKKMIHFKSISSRKIRTMRIFEILSNQNNPLTLSTFEIHNIYINKYGDDNCSLRDITFLLDEFTNIFLNLYHDIYTAILDENDTIDKNDEYDFSQKSLKINNVFAPKENDSLRNTIIDFVQQKGSVFNKDVYNYLYDKLDNPGSAGFILKNSDFILLAPGFYGLNKSKNEIIHNPNTVKKLLTVENCKQYILAKYAGEDNIYPMWNETMEREWLNWSSTNAPLDIYESLLYVSKPHDWNNDIDQKNSWIDLKKRFAKFHFKKGIGKSFSNYIPPIENIFRIIFYVYRNKSCNFISVNRIAKPLLFDDWKSSVILAILIKLKILYPSNHWMDNHLINDDNHHVEQYVRLFIEKFNYEKEISWTSSFGQELIETISQAQISSWINEGDFNLFINVLKRTKS